jgi:two-component system chemotaxis response regulator CheY
VSQKSSADSASAKKILVVDDSVTLLQQLEAFLTTNGFAVEKASDAQAGLEALRRSSFDLVFVDVNMPGMNGLEMIAEARKLPGYEKTPIFVLTTESTKGLMQRGKEAGATAWIVKPFKQDVVLKGIEHVLGPSAKG